jgi:single-stranded-DNA-specific exonuclease
MLLADDTKDAIEKAQFMDEMNKTRRTDQDKIFKEAILQVGKYEKDSVLVLSGSNWNHGIVGIVAAKILEKYKKPTIILEELGDITKGSARSYGDFHIADAIRLNQEIITSGGGHKFAAGVTLPTENLSKFRENLNAFYATSHKLIDQQKKLLPSADVVAKLNDLTEECIDLINQLEPFGHGNPEPILESQNLQVIDVRRMGDSGQHLKLVLRDEDSKKMNFVAFNAPNEFFVEIGTVISALYQPMVNEWMGKRSIEGRLVHVKVKD